MGTHEHATSSEVMRLVFDRAGVPLCLLAPDLTVLSANAQWLWWTGATAEQVLGRDILEVLPETRPPALALYERARQGETVDVPRHRARVNGRELCWEGRLAPIPMESGTGVLLAAREVAGREATSRRDRVVFDTVARFEDATCRERTEEALRVRRALEDELATVAATVPGALYCYRLRPDGIACCPFSTPAAEEMFGLKREEVAGDIAPLFARVHRDDLQQLQESIAESARTLSRWHGLFRYQHPKTGQRWIEAWSLPRKQPDGAILWHGYTTDVTERMRADEALRESEQRYRRFFQNLLELVGIHAAVRAPGGEIVDWVVRDVNEGGAALLARAREAVIGRRFGELFPPDVARPLTARWPDVIATGRAVQYEFAISGRVLWISVARMDVDTVAAVADDITVRKRSEEAIREADRRKSEFLAVLSHELRNPLAPIRNAIHLLERAGPGTGQAARAQAVIRRQTEHLARLVDDLLDVTRVSRGKIELQRARIDLREVVQRTCDDLHTVFEARGIALRTDMPEPVWVDADATRMAQVVGNLLQNAAKFSHEGASVALALSPRDGQAELRVRDDGVGVPPDLLPRLFEPFVQADNSLARTRGGLGLGLALVKGLVELHGGTVSARSEGADRGTEVTVRLPLATASRGQRPAAAPSPVRPAVVLVIEDNVDAATTLAEVLELAGHHVHVATDGQTGLARARELRPGIVLCDIGLPDVDGYEIARELRRDPAFRRTRLVAVSGYAQPDDRRRALEAGFDAHVAKPAPLDALLASLGAS